MLRFVVSERGRAVLAPVDVDDAVVVIGSGPDARIRLPGRAAVPVHVRIANGEWVALAPTIVEGAAVEAGASGAIGRAGVAIEIGDYRVHVIEAPKGSLAATKLRTESLARELVRGLLGADSATSLTIERGPRVGSKRLLSAPEATLVIGRGDEAGWVILDEDLSRTHASVIVGWDGVEIADMGSKNGTRVDGALVGESPIALYDGALVAIGNVHLRFHDPAERHLRGGSIVRAAPPPIVATKPVWPFVVACAVAAIALAGLIWIYFL